MSDHRVPDPRSVLDFERVIDDLNQQVRRMEKVMRERDSERDQLRDEIAGLRAGTDEPASVEELRDALADLQAQLDGERVLYRQAESDAASYKLMFDDLIGQRDGLWTQLAQGNAGYAANVLRALMSELSEQRMCAQWLPGMEYTLWEAAHSSEHAPTVGSWDFTDAECYLLRRLAQDAGGWWHWPEPEFADHVTVDDILDGAGAQTRYNRPQFIEIDAWTALYEDFQRRFSQQA